MATAGVPPARHAPHACCLSAIVLHLNRPLAANIFRVVGKGAAFLSSGGHHGATTTTTMANIGINGNQVKIIKPKAAPYVLFTVFAGCKNLLL